MALSPFGFRAVRGQQFEVTDTGVGVSVSRCLLRGGNHGGGVFVIGSRRPARLALWLS